MKSKTKKILLIFVLLTLIVLIPIGIFASRNLIIRAQTDEEIARANQKENERALAEKAKFANQDNVNMIDENYYDDGSLDLVKKKLEESDREEKKLIATLRKFYPDEFDKATAESQKQQDSGIVEFSSSPIKDYERTFYEMTLRILQEENLTDEERYVLKHYLEISMYSIQKDEDLKARVDKVLSE